MINVEFARTNNHHTWGPVSDHKVLGSIFKEGVALDKANHRCWGICGGVRKYHPQIYTINSLKLSGYPRILCIQSGIDGFTRLSGQVCVAWRTSRVGGESRRVGRYLNNHTSYEIASSRVHTIDNLENIPS